MKKHGWILFTATFVFLLFIFTINAQAVHEAIHKDKLKQEIIEELREEIRQERGPLAELGERIELTGYVEFGGVGQAVDNQDGSDYDESDFVMTTFELSLEAEVNEWVNIGATLLYEDFAFDNDETSVDLDVAMIAIGKHDEHPLYVSAGKIYVPFGGLLTHFPDDPLMDLPLALLMGEISEKAVLVGAEHQGFSLSGYLFNGDVDEEGEENHVGSYGFDANYSYDDKGFDLLVGASYISNIADSDGLEEALEADELEEHIAGLDAYLHLGYADFFVDAEYMAATDAFEQSELVTGAGDGAEPSVWNLELGYNLDWGKNLEIVLKYAGSDEAEALGFPEERYGLCLNQEIWKTVVVSLAYLHDEYEENDVDSRDERDAVFGQIAIGF